MSASAQKALYQEHPNVDVVVHSEGGVKRNVLIVDEQAHILRVLRAKLDQNGYKVDMALRFESALKLMRERHYDVLIITSDLPDMNTRQLCENNEKGFNPGSTLVLVSAGLVESWTSKAFRVEPLDAPVSMQKIVRRLKAEFADHH